MSPTPRSKCIGSFLGGIYITTNLANIDNCKSPGVYFVNGTSGSVYTTDDSIMRVSLAQYLSDDNTRVIIQERFPKNFDIYMIRKYYNNSWSDWQIMTNRGSAGIVDMDNLKTTGLYKMGGATDISSYITDYGVLLVLAYDDTHICQIKTGANDLHIGVRFYNGTWSSWTVIR